MAKAPKNPPINPTLQPTPTKLEPTSPVVEHLDNLKAEQELEDESAAAGDAAHLEDDKIEQESPTNVAGHSPEPRTLGDMPGSPVITTIAAEVPAHDPDRWVQDMAHLNKFTAAISSGESLDEMIRRLGEYRERVFGPQAPDMDAPSSQPGAVGVRTFSGKETAAEDGNAQVHVTHATPGGGFRLRFSGPAPIDQLLEAMVDARIQAFGPKPELAAWSPEKDPCRTLCETMYEEIKDAVGGNREILAARLARTLGIPVAVRS